MSARRFGGAGWVESQLGRRSPPPALETPSRVRNTSHPLGVVVPAHDVAEAELIGLASNT